MKKIIWNLFSKVFKSEISTIVEYEKSQAVKKALDSHDFDVEWKRATSNFPVGTKVLSQSNEPEPLFIGEVLGHEIIKNQIFIVASNGEKTLYLKNGNTSVWCEEREDALSKLSWDERFNVMSRYYYYLGFEDAHRKNQPEYINRKAI